MSVLTVMSSIPRIASFTSVGRLTKAKYALGMSCLICCAMPRLPCNLQLAGDIRFEVWNTDRVFHQDEKMFAFTIYSGCLAEGGLRLSRMEVDGAHKKKDLKVYDEAFAVELSYSFVAEEEVSTV
eukprot:TRINITY_DN10130_c0_g1_i1.p1 TRINITY_DN10130_c0_g1~~TRINITY_DN10130_c0_g1_i1.p1  ORF type:complete len:125 (+),score=25.29 TRINITY_DN10130_c0_g1_i1:104-478(+)